MRDSCCCAVCLHTPAKLLFLSCGVKQWPEPLFFFLEKNDITMCLSYISICISNVIVITRWIMSCGQKCALSDHISLDLWSPTSDTASDRLPDQYCEETSTLIISSTFIKRPGPACGKWDIDHIEGKIKKKVTFTAIITFFFYTHSSGTTNNEKVKPKECRQCSKVNWVLQEFHLILSSLFEFFSNFLFAFKTPPDAETSLPRYLFGRI